MDHLRRSKVVGVFEVITGDFPIDALQHSSDDAFATLTLSSPFRPKKIVVGNRSVEARDKHANCTRIF